MIILIKKREVKELETNLYNRFREIKSCENFFPLCS